MAMFGPKWWHHHGIKMHLKKPESREKTIVLEGSAASLTISGTILDQTHYWKVDWVVRQSRNEGSSGTCFFTDEDLAVAFGVKKVPIPSHSQHLVDRYGADRVFQGRFIAHHDYLNIPCPGTGHDGDPNISIDIDDTMREAIRKLLNMPENLF